MDTTTKKKRRTTAELIAHHEAEAERHKLKPLLKRAPKLIETLDELVALARHAESQAIQSAALDLRTLLEGFNDDHAAQ